MKDRLKELRKTLGLTQQKFADRLGISRGNVATYETRDGSPGSSVIALMCKEFNVSEQWLRTGDGDMFVAAESFDLGAYIKNHGVSELEGEILKAYFDLDPDIRQELLKHFRKRLAGVVSDPDQSTPPERETTAPLVDLRAQIEAEARAESEEYYRQILAEKEAAAGLSASTVFNDSTGTKLA